MAQSQDTPTRREHTHHPRTLGDNRYVYAVVSRRSGGVSIGINLNPDKRCNFDCVYCQVDRAVMPPMTALDPAALFDEFEHMLALLRDGGLFTLPRFADLPPELQQAVDVALSGDGEPTTSPAFADVVDGLLDRMQRLGPRLPPVLITNAAELERCDVARAVDRLMDAGGDVWAKLDAGTEAYYRRVCGSRVPFRTVLSGISATARRHPVTIQTCLMNLDGEPPPDAEIDAYTGRLQDIMNEGGSLRRVQLYNVARSTAQRIVTPLSGHALRSIAGRLRDALPEVAVEVFR
ncbi:MAG: radical SAM protein [Leptospirillia bacterium]